MGKPIPKGSRMDSFGPIETRLHEVAERRGAGLCILFDPDRHELKELTRAAAICQEGGADFVFVGSSLMLKDSFDDAVGAVRAGTDLPIIIFPGHSTQLSGKADAILFMSLVSGRNPEYLIGQQVIAAPRVRSLGLEPIPAAYLLVETGRTTSVQYMSMTQPMPRDKADIAVAHALAARYLGMRVLYLEGGSGGHETVPEEIIRAVAEVMEGPIIVGGGIRTAEQAHAKVEAGATLIVVGNSLEHAWTVDSVAELAAGVHLKG
jgi:phosphoglycerol geranylgeranyltransferase